MDVYALKHAKNMLKGMCILYIILEDNTNFETCSKGLT
jgi:hypothetical protein